MKVPVAFIIFKRPDVTRQVFAEIAKYQPEQLFIIADGPRPDRPGEADLCQQTRQIVENIDWDCDVHRDYSDVNLGVAQRVVTGLNRVFEHVEQAIILEDDCLPHPTFFQFCATLLERYSSNREVMAITGTNYYGKWKPQDASYLFSRIGSIWGWATWKRAWQLNDLALEGWEKRENRKRIKQNFRKRYPYWEWLFNLTKRGKLVNWGYPWTFTMMIHGVCIMPSVNLISNIGFGADATNTDADAATANLHLYPMQFPLIEPSSGIVVDQDFDEGYYELFPVRIVTRTTMIMRRIRRVGAIVKRFIFNAMGRN